MNAVLEFLRPALHQKFGGIGNRFANRFNPAALVFEKIREHVGMDEFLLPRMSDAEPHAHVIVSAHRCDRA